MMWRSGFGRSKVARAVALAASVGWCGLAAATVAIDFDPDGADSMKAVSVATFDWAQSSLLIPGGVPAGGLQIGAKVQALLHARVQGVTDPKGVRILGIPDDLSTEFTFIASVPMKVVDLVGSTLIFGWNDNSDNDPDYINKNYFEMWTGVKDSNDLSGTGFNNGVRVENVNQLPRALP